MYISSIFVTRHILDSSVKLATGNLYIYIVKGFPNSDILIGLSLAVLLKS